MSLSRFKVSGRTSVAALALIGCFQLGITCLIAYERMQGVDLQAVVKDERDNFSLLKITPPSFPKP
jgi:hypothetical protein